VYSDAYVNFKFLLKNIGTDFYHHFVPFDTDLTKIEGRDLTIYEKGLFAMRYLLFCIGIRTRKPVSELTKNFTDASKDLIDRQCRLTDGAGADTYAQEEFLQLINQQALNKLYQPSSPNDVGLFEYWKNYLIGRGIVINLNCEIASVDEGVAADVKGNRYNGDAIVLCLPPMALAKLRPKYEQYSQITEYKDYISITYHWKDELRIEPKTFASTEWGVAFVVTTKYAGKVEHGFNTVVSAAVTLMDRAGSTGKMARECTSEELVKETFSQIKKTHPNLQNYDAAILNPKAIVTDEGWETTDSAFFASSKLENPFVSPFVEEGVYTCGTHNGNSPYAFTSLESAACNALHLASEIVPGFCYELRKPLELNDLIAYATIFSIAYSLFSRKKN
jgi:hypothetical protein